MIVLRALTILAGLLMVWQLVVWLTDVPHFILPPPASVAGTLWDEREWHSAYPEAIAEMASSAGRRYFVPTAIQWKGPKRPNKL